LSDLGICCIDEFDKMTSDQHTLLEAMEQQTVSIAKGGILGSLSARCSVVACANPATGHYNRSRTIMENIRISNAILSRFDLVFLMLDDPDLQRDKKLSEHVMKLHSRNRKRKFGDIFNNEQNQSGFGSAGGMASQSIQSVSSQSSVMKRVRGNEYDPAPPGTDNDIEMVGYSQNGSQSGYNAESEFMTLNQRVKAQVERIPERDVIGPQLLKKYISYARHTVFPKLSIEACEVLKGFYISLRENAANNQNTLPITSRALDSLIRLSQARAKLELRTIVSREDSMDVVKLVQESIFEACYNEMGISGGYNGGGSGAHQ